ncbi:unnamed protein product [Caenorhabditis auriculariae]|uniref:Uncharacterized protein n=1 Tax=Caenorhabditis auriculariae TaxID=2777116 RepID=A0A8S1H195_9PELO|nr:unnamed protein product [Caenorhabditis auriculariae]
MSTPEGSGVEKKKGVPQLESQKEPQVLPLVSGNNETPRRKRGRPPETPEPGKVETMRDLQRLLKRDLALRSSWELQHIEDQRRFAQHLADLQTSQPLRIEIRVGHQNEGIVRENLPNPVHAERPGHSKGEKIEENEQDHHKSKGNGEDQQQPANAP